MSSNYNMPRKSHKNTAARKPSNNRTLNAAAKRPLNTETLYRQNEERYLREFSGRKPSANEWVYNKIIDEILLHLYLIYKGYRKTAEIKLNKVNDTVMRDIHTYLETNNICVKIERDKHKPRENINYLYLFKNRSDMNSINNSRGVKVADQLGEFYTCKSEHDEWKDYEWRVVILCNDIELFAQMCPPDKIAVHITKTMEVYNKIREYFIELDDKRFNATPNPLKISIYKTKVD